MHLLSKLKIGQRLALGFAIVLALSILTTIIGIIKLNAVADAAERMLDQPIKKERLASDWSRNIFVAVNRTSAIAKSSDASLVKFFAADAKATTESTARIVKELEPLLASEKEKKAFAHAMDIRKGYLTSRDHAIKLKDEGKAEESNAVLDKEYLPTAAAYMKAVSDFLAVQREVLDSLAGDIAAVKEHSRNAVIMLALLGVIFGVLISWWLTRAITRPIHESVAFARRVADGDLNADLEVRTADEFGQLQHALKDMNGNLRRLVGDIRSGAAAIAGGSSQIAAGNADLSARTEQQAGSLEETAASMEELTSTVRQNAGNADQAKQLADSASTVAVQAGTAVKRVVDTMDEINTSARRIVDIISVIDSIAFQTNILALNAAVEAARAGEQGRGFAVVAAEVRTLAQRSAGAAKEIKALIDDSVSRVDSGSRLVNEAGTTMDEVVESVRSLTGIMGEIASASREQSAGIEQVNQAISHMDQATQQNAALVEEAAAAAQSLQDQARHLEQLVSVFKLDHFGASSQHGTQRTSPRIGARTPAGAAAAGRSTVALAVPASARSAVAPAPRAAAQVAGGNDWTEF